MGEWETAPSGVDDLRRRLRDFQGFLISESFVALPEEERQALWRRARDLEEKLRQLEDRTLLIGLVGGTGVGKSTLMNALAQEQIASVSHRRPHTERVLIYRHARCLVPQSLKRGEGLFTEVIHGADAVRHVIMADLPDFDSLVPEHRERVLAFMEHLDLVLWVTTPEKYADGRFYEMLLQAPKARRNFAFVLNKADIFFSNSGKVGSTEDFDAVVRSFRRLVQHTGVNDPVLYVISAQEALNGVETSSWNQFPFLRRWVLQERDAKEILAIKGANLDAEFQSVAGRLQDAALQLGKAIRFLERLEASARNDQAEGNAASLVRSVFSLVPVEGILWQSLENPEDLRGGAAVIAWLAQIRAASPDSSHAGSAFAGEISKALEDRFRCRMDALRDYSAALAIQAGVSDPLRNELLERLSRSIQNLSVEESAREVVTTVLEQARRAGGKSWRLRQRLAGFFTTALLILALGGQEGWRTLLSQPGPANLVGLGAAMVEKLFSGEGLAAMGAWAFLQLVLGARFYREYKKSLQRRGEAIIDSLQSALEGVVREVGEKHLDVVRQCRKEIEDQREKMRRMVEAAPSEDRPFS